MSAHATGTTPDAPGTHLYPNHDQQLSRLGKVEGQIKGIRKMIEERRYCIEILDQIKAVGGALRQIQMGILEAHLHHCVRDAVEVGDAEQIHQKLEEVLRALSRIE